MANEVDDISQSNHLLSLKWNNHSSNFKVAIASLQEKAVLSDATIACDGHLFPVHKLVLSTCSDFFARVFSSTPCKHPVIVLHDLPRQNFTYLLSYMYAGEVNVPQAHLPTLIKAAETLQIKGLAAPDEEPAQGFLSAINGHSDRESSLEKSNSKLLKKRKCSNLDNAGNNNNQGSVNDDEDNLSSSAKRSKKSISNESNRRESTSDSILENDLASGTERESAQTSHSSVKNEHISSSAATQDGSYEEEGVQIKEEEECADQEEEEDEEEEESSVSQMWAHQQLQQSTAVNWNNEGSSNDLSWLPFSAARDRLGDGMESKLSSYTTAGNHHCDSTVQNSVHFSSGTTHSLAHASEADISSALSGGMLSASSLGSAAFGASDAEQLLSSVGRMEAFGSHANFMSLSSPSADRASYRKALGSPRNSSVGSPGRGASSRESSYRYRDKYSRSNGEGSASATGHGISGSMTRSIMSLGAVGSSLTHDCPICLKHFQSRADVVRHLRTHTGERPFKCPHCDYSAALKGNLKSHILSRHPDVLGNIDFILRNISPSK